MKKINDLNQQEIKICDDTGTSAEIKKVSAFDSLPISKPLNPAKSKIDINKAKSFLTRLHPEIQRENFHVCICRFKPKPNQYFFASTDEAIIFLSQQKSATDWYVQVCYNDGTKRSKYNALASSYLWVEVDAKNFKADNHEAKMSAAMSHIQSKDIKASMVVNSGGGYHLYFKLDSLFIIDTPEEIVELEELNIRLNNYFSTDSTKEDSIHDTARVLRIVGTFNDKYTENIQVELTGNTTEFTYSITELKEKLPSTIKPNQKKKGSLAGVTPVKLTTQSHHKVSEDDISLLLKSFKFNHENRKFEKLWNGEWKELGYESQSEADSALIYHLWWLFGHDVAKVDAVFRNSALYRDKWDKNPHYAPLTMGNAQRDVKDKYDPNYTKAKHDPNNKSSKPNTPNQVNSKKPEIKIVEHETERMNEECWDALKKRNNLFLIDNHIARLDKNDKDKLVPKIFNKEDLTYELNRAATYLKYLKTQNDYVMTSVKDYIVNDIFVTPNKGLPPLKEIVDHPYFMKGGELVIKQGYNDRSKLYLERNYDKIDIPDKPSQKDVEEAKEHFEKELIPDFRFETESDRATAIALALTPFIKEEINGKIPIIMCESSTSGTGKTLLANTLTYHVNNEFLKGISEGEKDDEFDKRINAELLKLPPFLFIDNINRKLKVQILQQITTQQGPIPIRILGRSKSPEVDITPIIIITGNNPEMHRDYARRVLPIRLDSDIPTPELRTGFKHTNQYDYIKQCRIKTLRSALIIIKNWYNQDMPMFEGQFMTSFIPFCKIIGGILQSCGVKGFLANREAILKKYDIQDEVFIEFLAQWYYIQNVEIKNVETLEETHELRKNIKKFTASELTKAVFLDEGALYWRQDPRAMSSLLRKNTNKVFTIEACLPNGTNEYINEGNPYGHELVLLRFQAPKS
ncbi:MAG: hypothetical protein HQK65_21870, partial [Desulfamplus sp.]|nr:hypothetical protein [Desulfamplus sp.]